MGKWIIRIREFFKSYWRLYIVLLAVVEPLSWFLFEDIMKEVGIVGYLILIFVPAFLVAVLFISTALLQKIQRPSTRLTLKKPEDTFRNRWRWRMVKTKCEYTKLLDETEATMLITLPGVSLDKFVLIYDENNIEYERYDKLMSVEIKSALNKWKTKNPDKFEELNRETWGKQVRLEKFIFDHDNYQHRIMLSPIKFLYYQAIQSSLWKHSNASLRKKVFGNSLTSLIEEEQPLLPNHFALHMAIVSSDEMLLIRKRSSKTPLFPGVWEASIGEFMHGPDKRSFPHFTDKRKPDLNLFCVNSVFEETNYKEGLPSQFKIYGFGIEYRTLAPKIFIVFRSESSMGEILSQGEPKDMGQELSSIELKPQKLAEMFSKGSGYLWSPSSRIISLLALTSSVDDKGDRKRRLEEFSKYYRV